MSQTPSRAKAARLVVPLWMGGKEIEGEGSLDVVDPAAPQQVVGQVALASRAQVLEALDAAHAAFGPWSRMPIEARVERVLSALPALEAAHAEGVELLVRENGKARGEAEMDVAALRGHCQLAAMYASELGVARRLPRSEPEPAKGSSQAAQRSAIGPAFRSEVTRVPAGIVSIIVPYNWPLAIASASLPYALIAGNTTIVKPPPTAPLCLSRMLHTLAAALPPGVLNVLSGTNEAVAPLASDPRVSRLVFTGSVPAGKTLMRLAAESLTRVTLELGGNDPAFVLEDADLDRAALERLVLACFLTSGQVCMGVKRIYVHRSRYSDVVSGMSEILARYRVGPGLSSTSTIGPLNNARQRDIVEDMCAEARARGHEVLELGTIDEDAARRGGYFLRPRLVLSPDPGLRIVTEEQFGPAVPILPFDDVSPLIDQVNAEWCGLGSSVWTGDWERGAALAARLRTGTTWINNASALATDMRAPFGGFRQSGIGRELGSDGMCEYTELHTVTFPE